MRILIAEDESVSREVLNDALTGWGYEVVVTCDGAQAWTELQKENAPPLAILDWMMPHADGVELCRRARATTSGPLPYLILATAKDGIANIVAGLNAGASDYVVKPFDLDELHARIQMGERMTHLHAELLRRTEDLKDVLAEIRLLQAAVPAGAHHKERLDRESYWRDIEAFIAGLEETRTSEQMPTRPYLS